MIRACIRWAVNNHAAMNLIMIASVVIGGSSLLMLRREVFPNFQLEIVLVTVVYPGASPDEVEEAICQKIEAAVRSIDGITKVSSSARESSGFAVLEISSSANVEKVLAEIRSEVDRIPSFPELAEDPEIQQITFRNSAIRVGVMSERSEAADADLVLRDFAEQVRDDLLQLKTVSQAKILGERPYQIDVEISAETLRKYGLTLQQVSERLRRENVEIPGGRIQAAGQSMLLRGKNKLLTGSEIAQIPLVTRPDGTVLTIGDLGQVQDGFEDTKLYQRLDGKAAQVISIDRTSSEDLIRIVDEVKQYVASKQCPPGYSLNTMYDTSIDVRERIELLAEDGLQGLILVVLVLAIFLEFRLALWVATGIPFAILATSSVLLFAGETLNMLTLFSFLMALGILVDDAIVISENFHTYREQGHSLKQSAVLATSEVAGSVTTGVMCTVIAFMPLFFVSGIMGKFIACMPLTVIAMLLISLAEGLTILACHLGHDQMLPEMMTVARRLRTQVFKWHWLHFGLLGWLAWIISWLVEQILHSCLSIFRLVKRVFDWINVRADRFVNFSVGKIYLPSVRRAVGNVPIALSIALAFLIITLTGISGNWVPRTLFPNIDSRLIVGSISFPDGTPIEITDVAIRRMAQGIQQVSLEHSRAEKPLTTAVHEIVGGNAGVETLAIERATGEFSGSVIVELCGAGDRDLRSDKIVELWREATGSIVGAEELNFRSATMGPGGKTIEFLILADRDDWDQLVSAVEESVAKLRSYNAVAEINDNLFEGKWEYHIRINERARAMGVTTADLAETVRASYFGQEAMRLQRGRHEVKLMVRYPKSERDSLDSLENIRIRGTDGVERPISELAEISTRRGYQSIERLDQKRVITISGDVKPGGDAEQVLKDFELDFVPGLLERYPNVAVKWEGQRQQNDESLESMRLGAIIAVFAMYVLLVFNMKSLLEPLIILCVIPFAMCGAYWGHYAMGLELTIFSFFGMVALTGLVVNDSIVLLDFINLRLEEYPGEPLIESIVEAGRRRIRPMALNTVTSIIGIVPLVTNTTMQAQLLIPMGVSLVFGLAASTAIGLFVVPIMFYMLAQVIPPNRDHDVDDESPDSILSNEAISSEDEPSLDVSLAAVATPAKQPRPDVVRSELTAPRNSSKPTELTGSDAPPSLDQVTSASKIVPTEELFPIK